MNSQQPTTMICVLEAKIVEVPQDHLLITVFKQPRYLSGNPAHDAIDLECAKELIKGQKYVTRDGRTLCLGMSKQVQDALGIPFQVFEKMRNELEDAKFDMRYLIKQVSMLDKELARLEDSWVVKLMRTLEAYRGML